MDDELQLLTELHIDGERQGPGSDAMTRRALALAGLAGRRGLRVADIGCGTGAASLLLARELASTVIAVDFLQPFLDALQRRAAAAGGAGRIETRCADMGELDFAPDSLDLIWSEGAVYNIGFQRGIRAWRAFLRPGGVLAVSELTWLTRQRPATLQNYWDDAYPEVATAAVKIGQLEAAGYRVLGYFPLPTDCWLAHYYEPLRARLQSLLERHPDSTVARELAAAEEREMALYEANQDHVSYGFYIAQRSRAGRG